MNDFQWRLSGEMFIQAVGRFERDRLPYPIRVLPMGPTEIPPTADEYERFQAEAAQQLQAIADENMFRAFRTLLEPQVRIEVHGAYDRGFERIVRIHAGIAGNAATLAIQEPGPTKDYGGDIHVQTCAPHELAARVVAALPRCAPGRFPAVRGSRADIGQIEYSRHPSRISRIEQINQTLRRARSGIGEIGIFAGPAIDSRPTGNPHGFHWMDLLPQDGRYLLIKHSSEDFTLAPGSPDEIVRRLQHAIGVVRQTPQQASARISPQAPDYRPAPQLHPRRELSPQVTPRRAISQEEIDADDAYFEERNQRGWLA